MGEMTAGDFDSSACFCTSCKAKPGVFTRGSVGSDQERASRDIYRSCSFWMCADVTKVPY